MKKNLFILIPLTTLVASQHAKLIDFKIKNNLKSAIEYGPLGIRGGAPINTDLIGGSRTLQAGGSITEKVDNDQTPIFLFRVQGDPKLYQFAFPHTAKGDPYDKIDVTIEKGPTIKPASMFTGIKTKDIIEMPYKEQPAMPRPQPKVQKTPNQLLFDAAEDGDAAAVQKALSLGANINLQDGNGLTALMWATKANNKAVVEELIKQGANVMLTSKESNKRAINYTQDLSIKSLLLKAEKAAMAPKIPQAPGAPSGGYSNQKPTISPAASKQIESGKTAIQNEITDLNAKLASVDAANLKARYDLVMDQFRALKSFLGSPANRKWAESTRDKLNTIRTEINKRIAAEKAAALQAIPQAPALDIPDAPPLDSVPAIPQAPPLIPSKPASTAPAPKISTPSTPAKPSTPALPSDLKEQLQVGGTKLRKVSEKEKQQDKRSELQRQLENKFAGAGSAGEEDEEVDKEAMAREQAAVDKLAAEIYKKFSAEYKNRLTEDIAQAIAKILHEQPNQDLKDSRVQKWVKEEIAKRAPLAGGQAGGVAIGGIKVDPTRFKKGAQEFENWD